MRAHLTLVIAMALASLAAYGADLHIGWAECDITPGLNGEKKIPLVGQYYVREAKSVHQPLKFSVCVMRQGKEQIVMGALDLVSSWEPFTENVGRELHRRIPEFQPENIFISATHTHAGPDLRYFSDADYLAEWAVSREGFLNPKEYYDMIFDKVVDACERAWNEARPGTVSRAFGNARVGHCRLAGYSDGTSEMYGDTSRDDFTGMLSGEDSGVDMLFTQTPGGELTGVFVNSACPAQVMELLDVISSDFAGALRDKLKGKYGEEFHMIYHYGHGGDQSPRDLTRAKSLVDGFDGWHSDAVDAISDRLLTAVEVGAATRIPCPSVLRQKTIRIDLPLRRVTPKEVAAAKKQNAELLRDKTPEELWNDYLAEVARYAEDESRLPYDSKLNPFCVKAVNDAVILRQKEQKETPTHPVLSHIVRIGDVAFAGNPFELYLLYGQTIKARSKAAQTFIICKCDNEGYLPSEISEKMTGYSGGVNVGLFGHEAGYMFCDRTVREISELFE